MPATSSSIVPPRAARPLVAGVVGLVLALALAACGGDAQGTASPAAGQRGPGLGQVAQDPKVQACLKTHGVALPARGARPGGPSGAGPRRGANAPPATTTTGPGSGPAVRDPARFAKLQAALKACGVPAPAGRPGAPPGGAAPTQTAPSAATS